MERRAVTLQRTRVRAIASDDFSAGEVLSDGGSSAAALRSSERLVEGARMRVFGVCAVIWTLALTLPFACGLLHEGIVTVSWMLVYLLTRALDTSLAAVLAATAYDHLLQRPQS